MKGKTVCVFITTLCILSICVSCTQEPPKCEDEKTLSLARQILYSGIHDRVTDLERKEFDKYVKFEYPRPSAYDGKIQKYNCEMQVVAGNQSKVQVNYESQIVNKEHLVAVSGMSLDSQNKIIQGIILAYRNDVNPEAEQTKSQTTSDNNTTTSQSSQNQDKHQTRWGNLEIKNISEGKKGLFHSSKLLYTSDDGYLDVDTVYNLGKSDVALVSESTGGSGVLPSYFFVTITESSNPIISEEFHPNQAITPVPKYETITIDLGNNEGKHEVLTYKDGKFTIEKATLTGQANEEDCKYLYEGIYVPFVNGENCNDTPEEIGGMSTARAYNLMTQNDKRLNANAFMQISKESCTGKKVLDFDKFKSLVCSGK